MSARRALATLAIGEPFRRRWHEICRPNWQRYAARHGYDLICLDAPLDQSARARGRSPAWQKCLILGHPACRDYERVVWVDLDVLVNPLAPDIAAGVPLERVGAVDEYAIPTAALHRRMLAKNYARWRSRGIPFIANPTPREYYTVAGFAHGFDHVVQTGVLVLSPAHHRDLLESVYRRYEDRGAGWNYEMRPLSYELLRAGCVQWLDPRFNAIWGIYESLYYPFLVDAPASPRLPECLADARGRTYFLHFAGATELMPAAAAIEPAAAAPRDVERSDTPAADESASAIAPVALFLFNRPAATAAVFDVIRQVRPATLLLIADGPRRDHATDVEACAAARAVVAAVDWPCDVRVEFAAANLGIRRRIDSGMAWIFAQVEEAIVLEDDCVPEASFFRFCTELLERYRDDPRVLSICGNNFQFGRRRGAASYYFSRYCHIWGWATWRRAWAHYDAAMTDWPAARDAGWLEARFASRHARQYWSYIFETNFRDRENWDYAWNFSYWRQGGVHVLPNRNLVSNHGFGVDSTHTTNADSLFAFLPTEPMRFPLVHPASLDVDDEADAFTEEIMFSGTLTRAFERVRAERRRGPEPPRTRPGADS